MPTASTLIWISAKPLLKLVINTSFGYFLTKADLFSAAAARGAGQVLLNIFLPALLFSKIVPGYTAQNIVALGPLILVACIYQLYGLVIAWITRKIFWVPRRFHSGILAAGIWSNWGDLPTAVIMSMTASAPFSPGDSDVAVAYLSAFILVFFVTLFPFGGSRLIEKDFLDKSAPVDSEDEIPESASSRLRRRWNRLQVTIQNRRGAIVNSDVEKSPTSEQDEKVSEIVTPKLKLSRHVSFNPSEPTAYNGLEGGQSTRPPSAHVSPAPTVVEGIHNTMSQNPAGSSKVISVPTEARIISATETEPSRLKRVLLSARTFLRSFASPATLTMVVAFVVALVPQIKALFIAPPAGSNIHIHPAPDGLPPLNIIMDTATFIGNASVPLGLICLGSALARLQVPKPISRAPLGAITLFSILKMVIGPVFGVLVVEALTHRTSLIDPNDKVLRFVCIYFAGVPTATTQVYLTQIYSPDGSATHVSAFLIPQYALMFVTMTALSAYALTILF
ncbi:Protein ECM3 OS=Saccharomyces cerevisiae (strain ATCC 204508 / S288c) GN=ECM3 PE=1 SV=1 [Rhizoctonia solani AG-1 IB]|uniref:Protein ECM3 n=1 Tax=Thanatephorus cucumeris (strain AG1-IB / isolate 7/3/14) TaxID=1108050 RepID=A0A0B7FUP8_THACB|nr:Protein ECM3 OS=Saccharomyces cerevisiae (strain ATCC 204508 / S288c) GN=ECM3 PE=1 SV=1 [Rhizoctonia solani AG-1 IB]